MKVLESILGTKTGEQMRTEAAHRHLAKREALAQALDAADIKAAEARRPLVERRDRAVREVTSAEEALNVAKAKAHSTRLLLAQHDVRAERERTRHETDLLNSAGEELDAFIGRCNAESERLRNWRLLETRRQAIVTGYSIGAGVLRTVATVDNYDAIAARLDALSKAVSAAYRLAGTQATFTDELTQLWNNLPEEKMR